MTRSINALLNEANELIAKYDTPAESKPAKDEDIFKLAEQIKSQPKMEHGDWSAFEKVAWAYAIVDTVNNLGHIKKLAEFERKAAEKSIPQEKVAEYINKYASQHYVSAIPEVLK